MKLHLVKHHKFKRDALQVFVYIGERNMDAAERFLEALDSDLKKLAEMPGMGPLETSPTNACQEFGRGQFPASAIT